MRRDARQRERDEDICFYSENPGGTERTIHRETLLLAVEMIFCFFFFFHFLCLSFTVGFKNDYVLGFYYLRNIYRNNFTGLGRLGNIYRNSGVSMESEW